jgi:hypothetical protein
VGPGMTTDRPDIGLYDGQRYLIRHGYHPVDAFLNVLVLYNH